MSEASFEDLAERFQQAFVRMFAPEVAAEIVEAQAAGVPRRSLRALYDLSHADFEAGFWDVITSSMFKDETTFYSLKAILDREISDIEVDRSTAAANMPTPLRGKNGEPLPATRLQAWLRVHDQMQYMSDMEELELVLYRLYWAAAHPEYLQDFERRNLMQAFSDIRKTAPALLAIELKVCNWPQLTPAGYQYLYVEGPTALAARGADPELWVGDEQ